MGRFKLDKAGVQKIKKMLYRQVYSVKAQLALDAYVFLTTFDYNIYGGDTNITPFGLTQWMASNWNVSIGSIDPYVEGNEIERDYYYTTGKKFPVEFMRGIKELQLKNVNFQSNKSIFVTNSVPYALVLERGGVIYDAAVFEGESAKSRDVEPNRYIERATEYVKENIHAAVVAARETCPEIH